MDKQCSNSIRFMEVHCCSTTNADDLAIHCFTRSVNRLYKIEFESSARCSRHAYEGHATGTITQPTFHQHIHQRITRKNNGSWSVKVSCDCPANHTSGISKLLIYMHCDMQNCCMPILAAGKVGNRWTLPAHDIVSFHLLVIIRYSAFVVKAAVRNLQTYTEIVRQCYASTFHCLFTTVKLTLLEVLCFGIQELLLTVCARQPQCLYPSSICWNISYTSCACRSKALCSWIIIGSHDCPAQGHLVHVLHQ